MRRFGTVLRLAVMTAACGSLGGVGCANAVFREAQFGLLDGVNSFVAQSVVAVLTGLVPFLSQA